MPLHNITSHSQGLRETSNNCNEVSLIQCYLWLRVSLLVRIRLFQSLLFTYHMHYYTLPHVQLPINFHLRYWVPCEYNTGVVTLGACTTQAERSERGQLKLQGPHSNLHHDQGPCSCLASMIHDVWPRGSRPNSMPIVHGHVSQSTFAPHPNAHANKQCVSPPISHAGHVGI